jgi:hypothetical protein
LDEIWRLRLLRKQAHSTLKRQINSEEDMHGIRFLESIKNNFSFS